MGRGRAWAARALVGIVGGAGVVAACGGGSTSPASPPDDAGPSVTVEAGQEGGAGVSTATIGPAGGRLVSADERLTLDIPEGALPNEVAIRITPVANPPEGAVGPAYQLEPDGLTFAVPITVEYRFLPESVDESFADLRPAVFVDGVWKPWDIAWLEPMDGKVSAFADHFSTHGTVRATKQPPATGEGPSGCRCLQDKYASCCDKYDALVTGPCSCWKVCAWWDRDSCSRCWKTFHSFNYGVLECHQAAGGAGLDSFYCSEDWVACCRSAGGIGPQPAGVNQVAIESEMARGCVCNLGCRDSVGPWAESSFNSCLRNALRKGKRLVGPPACSIGDAGITDAGSTSGDCASAPIACSGDASGCSCDRNCVAGNQHLSCVGTACTCSVNGTPTSTFVGSGACNVDFPKCSFPQ